jgi:1-aminocyclopropane-1-carboxylate deaminase
VSSVPTAAASVLARRRPSPLQEAADERFTAHGVRLLLKRDDLLHPELVGNKWRKLVPNLRSALTAGHHTLLTFGGAYSNHLRSTAAAGRLLGLHTIGVVRGEELAARPLNDSLARCAAHGMRLHFVSRKEYRERHEPHFADRLRDRFGAFYLLPEGGSNALAVRSCAGLGRELDHAAQRPDVVAIACGTGGTLAGLAAGLGPGQSALGVPVLKGGFLAAEVHRLQIAAFGGPRGDWELADGFHHGGYGRTPPQLAEFAADFARRHGLPPLDCSYVAKLIFALTELAGRGAFPPGTTVAAVITG